MSSRIEKAPLKASHPAPRNPKLLKLNKTEVQQAKGRGFKVHVVEKRENLTKIAQKYGLTVAELKKIPGNEAFFSDERAQGWWIYPGEALLIPPKGNWKPPQKPVSAKPPMNGLPDANTSDLGEVEPPRPEAPPQPPQHKFNPAGEVGHEDNNNSWLEKKKNKITKSDTQSSTVSVGGLQKPDGKSVSATSLSTTVTMKKGVDPLVPKVVTALGGKPDAGGRVFNAQLVFPDASVPAKGADALTAKKVATAFDEAFGELMGSVAPWNDSRETFNPRFPKVKNPVSHFFNEGLRDWGDDVGPSKPLDADRAKAAVEYKKETGRDLESDIRFFRLRQSLQRSNLVHDGHPIQKQQDLLSMIGQLPMPEQGMTLVMLKNLVPGTIALNASLK